MEDFYRAMTTYINSKKLKEICYHARTIRKNGWETCLDCRSRLSRIFYDDPYTHLTGYITKPKEDRFPKIRETMLDMMYAISRKGGIGIWGEECYYEPPEAGLPRELFDHTTELCTTCMDLGRDAKCHRRSLCAAVLWEKVKSSYPMSMALTEFSKRVGVSELTIKKLTKE